MPRREQQSTHLEMRAHLAAIVASAGDAILSQDLGGRILSWNRGAEALYGHTAAEIVGQPISVLVPDDRLDEVASIMTRLRAGAVVDHFETVRLRSDGTTVPVSLTISPVRDEHGVITAVSTIARDITERHQADALRSQLAAEVAAARDKAVEVSRLKSDFLATMSHEIRTPMNGVIGMTGLLLDTELDPRQREYAEMVRSSGEALLAIINDILDFSKVEAGRLDLEVIDFDLRTILEEVADLLAEAAHAKGLELATLVRPDVPTLVRGDPGRLRQILTNLVGNAVKFTDHGEVAVRAVEAMETDDDVMVGFEVCDTGIGIPAHAQAALFDPFSQADSSTTRTHGGTGLGLAISRQLIELMDGRIEVDSEPGRGSTFRFWIRLAKRPEGPTRPPPRADLVGLRVLIVDDNATNRRILEQQVASWGMRSTIVDSGSAALEALRAAHARGVLPDVALLDMDMPDMDGIETAEAIRARPELADVPLLLLTSSALRGSAAAARQAGFSAFLTKPVRQSQLFDAIATVLGATRVEEPSFVTGRTISEARSVARPPLLVAEDNTVNQMVTVAVLAKLGYRADVVSNGAEAIEALSRIPYGAVLMDCQMPEMDGYEATAEIRRREDPAERLPIIALTAGAMAGDRERCLAAGMDDYIAKPMKVDELAAILERWVPAVTPAPDESDAVESNHDDRLLDPGQIASLRMLTDIPGGEERIADLVTTFLDGARGCIDDVRAADGVDPEQVQQRAHSLAGSSATLGAREVHRLARRLETTAEDAAPDDAADAVEEILDQLEAAINEVAPVLRAALVPAPPAESPPGVRRTG